MTTTTALIDGDVFAYRVAAKNETVIEWPDGTTTFDCDVDAAKSELDDMLGDFADILGADRTMVALSVSRCFRYDILPTYKHNRRDVRRPILLRPLKDHLTEKYGAQTKPRLEADDILGIWATWPKLPGKKIIVSIDKDLKQIPGWLYNPNHDEAAGRIGQGNADYFHMKQTLMGDVTDGYKGCPGIGEKRAAAALLNYFDRPFDSTVWQSVVKTYEAKNLTEADALAQAQVARICRATDYDFDRKEPIPWTPTA